MRRIQKNKSTTQKQELFISFRYDSAAEKEIGECVNAAKI